LEFVNLNWGCITLEDPLHFPFRPLLKVAGLDPGFPNMMPSYSADTIGRLNWKTIVLADCGRLLFQYRIVRP
jgi:hypothetical protein